MFRDKIHGWVARRLRPTGTNIFVERDRGGASLLLRHDFNDANSLRLRLSVDGGFDSAGGCVLRAGADGSVQKIGF
jgi:hypothetical protein